MIDRDKYAYIPMEEYNRLVELKADFDAKIKYFQKAESEALDDKFNFWKQRFQDNIGKDKEKIEYLKKVVTSASDQIDSLNNEINFLKNRSFWQRLINTQWQK